MNLPGMKDFELYQQILGLVEPWRVESVTLKPQEREIEVRVGFADTLWGCPQCQQRMQIHDYEERRWRHLDSCQFKTIIVSRVPNVRCPEAEERAFRAVTGSCTLPLIGSSRFLGTLSLEFQDDSGISKARRDFLETIASALSNALARTKGTEWYHAWVRHFNTLDDLMLAKPSPVAFDAAQEQDLYNRVTQMAFDLTYAACALYYRLDAPCGNLILAAAKEANALVNRVSFPKVIQGGRAF